MTEEEKPVESTEAPTFVPASIVSKVTPAEWTAMQNVLTAIYDYQTEDGEYPCKLFQRKVNRRIIPDYYDVIKEPVALSTIKSKINNKEYVDFKEFVRDFALIPHNAQVYNRPESGAYIDALVLKDVLQKELQKLVGSGTITAEVATLPFLGEIPDPDEPTAEVDAEGEDDEEEAEDEDEDEDEEDDSEEEGGRKKKKRRPGRPSGVKRENSSKIEKEKDEDEAESRKRRGRPPKVDTPMEARIKSIIRNMRRVKNTQGNYRIGSFERLPDKAAMPEYFAEIKNPMAMDVIKKKIKRKKYPSVDEFMKDVNLMFDNAKSYNTDDSEIYRDAVVLQKEARQLADEQKKRPDADFALEDGRIPLPNGILHNGELWKVGDWVHILNANDLTKPIVAQLYRTWQDTDGGKWVNACWYYRPEQTVHRYDRHFFESEVVKTGQYRDHPIDEIIDRCFVMFVTRFNKGRPRGLPADKDVYVCEARYNEEKHKMNKIKTWASCLPDEVRDKDYEMDLFDAPKKMKKVPSPIKYLFKEGEQKETDELPKPIWGAPNAPPKIGAVHCRPRDPRDSPPPEPTPTPPPAPPPPARVPPPQYSAQTPSYSQARPQLSHQPSHSPMPIAATPSQSRPSSSYSHAQQSQYHQQSASPAPPQPNNNYQQQPHPQQQRPTPNFQPPPVTPGATYQPRPAPTPVQGYNGSSTPHASLQYSSYSQSHQQSHSNSGYQQPSSAAAALASSRPPSYHHQSSTPTGAGYNAPQPIEVYRLPDSADDMIPPDVRSQFQTDTQGRVLFFTVPPAERDTGSRASNDGRGMLEHSAKYLAWKMKRQEELEASKQKQQAAATSASSSAGMTNGTSTEKRSSPEIEELGANGTNYVADNKRQKVNKDQRGAVILDDLQNGLAEALASDYRRVYGDQWSAFLEKDLSRWAGSLGGATSDEDVTLGLRQISTVPIRGVNGMLEFTS